MAAGHPERAAAVTDGTAVRTRADVRGESRGVAALGSLIAFGVARVASGMTPGLPLADAARRAGSPILLISAGRDLEYRPSRRYARLAGANAEHWNLPRASHTHAIHSDRAAYERRVLSFLGAHLR
jgi:hypothetical protein